MIVHVQLRLELEAAGREHVTLTGGGHFLQEDVGPQLAAVIAQFVATT
jgi:haloalkane dehalogenase